MIALVIILLLLASESFKARRTTHGTVKATVSAVITAFVVWLVALGMDWNGQFPIWLWWAFAIWAAALVGLNAARLMRARPGHPRAAARTAPQ